MGILRHTATRRNDGFTIVELIVIIVVMGILTVLAVVNLGSTQTQARDKTRVSNMNTLAANIERYYTNGDFTLDVHGSYPTTSMIGSETTYLPDLARKILFDPSSGADVNDPGATTSLVAATNADQTIAGILPLPDTDTRIYVYQPLTTTNALCTSTATTCIKFNLFYYQEVTNTVGKITSRHQ